MKVAAILMLALVAMTAVLSTSSASAVTLTSQWQIIAYNSANETTTSFEAKEIMNITVYPPANVDVGGVRSLIIWSEEQKTEFVRYTLGFYGGNQTAVGRNISVNLAAFSALINGDTLLLQIRNPTDQIEFTTAVSIKEDVQALLEEQRQFLVGLWNLQQRQLRYLEYQIEELNRNMSNYFMLFGIVIAFMVAYITRDRWLNKKKKDEEQKSTTEFEHFLEQFIMERYAPGDSKGEGAET